MEGTGVGSLAKILIRTLHLPVIPVRVAGGEPVVNFSHLPVVAQQPIGYLRIDEDLHVSWVQLQGVIEVAHGVVPAVLSAVDVCTPFKNPSVIRKRANG